VPGAMHQDKSRHAPSPPVFESLDTMDGLIGNSEGAGANALSKWDRGSLRQLRAH
jgi:hypothetical protein